MTPRSNGVATAAEGAEPFSPRSPRPVLQPGEALPSPEELCGREWHMGDPHSKYRFMRVLGTGHYGVTYLCSCLKTGQLVAVKALDKLHPEYERDAAIEEIRILAAVSDHPNVVDLHEIWEDSSYIFIVMEACMGGELFDMVIERKHFTEADAAAITAAVLSVMEHCHKKGIIHRDLKPENFLLLREGELSAANLRAIDFGLSKFVGRDGICRACVGSSYYVAPEVLQGAYSFEADAWSVGTITYILLSGFPPFWGSSDQVIFHRILHKPVDFDYQPWHQISAAAKDFVSRLLHKDPSKRMSVSQGLRHPWIVEENAEVPLSAEIISRLQTFTHQNRVKCLLMTIAAHHLSDEEIGGLRKIFHFIDADHDGEISMHDLTVAMQHTGLDWEQQGIMRLLAGLDLARDGTVHVEEFIAAALDQRKVLNAKNIKSIFAELDHDRDGLITVKELKDALEECNISIKAETLGRLMDREGALDAKGMVSVTSFSELLMNGASTNPLELETWMQDVHQFSSANSFKQLAMLVVARHMQPSEVESLRQLFQHLDEEATGTISLQQLQDAMRHMGKQVGEAELRELLEALDIRNTGCIEYDEFLAACLEEQHLTETKLRAAFDFFDRDATGRITQSDVVQVLKDVGMDASQADELMAAASGAPSSAGTTPRGDGGTGASGGGTAGSSAAGSGAADGGSAADSSAASSRTISFEDFRRLLLSTPPSIITKALSRASSRSSSRSVSRTSSGAFDVSPLPPLAGTGGLAPQNSIGAGLGGRGVLETALQSIRRSSNAPAALARPPPTSPDQGPAGGLRLSTGAGAYLPPPDNDFEPLDYKLDYELDSPHPSSRRISGMGPEPPSPISLMPRWDPPSPIDLRPQPQPPSPIDLRPRAEPPSPSGSGSTQQRSAAPPSSVDLRGKAPSPVSLRPWAEPPSPISLLPRAEPPSPGALSPTGSGGRGSPGYLPYSPYLGGVGSPVISLAAPSRREPLSPMGAARSPGPLDGAGGSGVFSPTARASGPGTGGLTLQQILQQYSSSGYKSRGASSRRNSMEVPAGGRRSMDAGSVGGSMARESILSQSAMSDLEDISWLGDN